MGKQHLVSLSLFLIPLLGYTHSLTCWSCQLESCPVVTDCKAGLTMDVCNCCPVCAQAAGEKCGGSFDLNGKCGTNLYCHESNFDSGNATCKVCEELIYSGCSVIRGVCQCGNSCTQPFDFADKESCLNSVLSQEDTDYCAGKICPEDLPEHGECPEDSYRPAKKLSEDGCCYLTQQCKCMDTKCHSPPACPAGTMIAELSRGNQQPGSCCSQYTCINATVQCGVGNSTFTNKMDNCLECKCRGGVVTCNYMSCDEPSCEWSALVPGRCCPQCKGCVSSKSGQRYSNGEMWKEDDSCIQCQCVDGQSRCTTAACERRCLNAKKVPGQCCPVCDDNDDYEIYNGTLPPISTPVACPEVTICPTNCRKKITVEINGCTVCLCEDDINMCDGSTGCSKVCPNGYKKDREKGCSYCRCNACPTFSCNLICPSGYAKDIGGCNRCECVAKKMTTPAPICFTSEGRTYSSGDSWFDGCRQCYCENGREMCSLINCPLVSCKQPLVKPGDCCPSCLFEAVTAPTINISMSCVDANGEKHLQDDVWQLDLCTVCMCHQGHAFCETKRCPPTLCTHPVTRDGQCCAVCEGKPESHLTIKVGKSCTTIAGTEFDHGSVWKLGVCQSCTCRDGTVTCFSQTCPSLSCKTTVQQKGQCCPKCTAESTYDRVCVYKGMWHTHLQTWEDNKLQCTCVHGRTECEPVGCIPCDGDHKGTDNQPLCCPTETDAENDETFLPSRIGLPMVILLSIILLIFSAVIVFLIVIIVRQRKKQKLKLTAIPGILEKRALHNTRDNTTKKRPKSTNLEFLHSTNDNRYNTAVTKGDPECFKPLVDTNHQGNEYIQC